ncbi:TPA: DUF1353 domain-containing protein [Vibrio alginolyticus]|uniref:DUF1353 domain-containing protein n=1 Tax=Vibrio alginolyticus TaxID=663 RepID=UPI001BD42EA8|nr:DUF1353 domain-containing protein [Vibrio alginolyticus]EGQ8445234.1 DUF1353 domain-containing protein [Vibrio alginolyticus]EJV5947559.1 DUF1353 domain-containing protein [Vibrio alginolyticus]MBT0012233.1 DUF1353 domain-containing protein [Vibrio alginolyticus]MBT0040254.1 DUF1353 domain-containing protein [Vibrio alginolyticus]MCR9963038.1 DUF1353 domain-containing protein [Vibrio alginolyticus]
MKYKKRQKYKYTLHSEEKIETHISVSQAYDSPFLSLSKQGVLTIKKGYAWDGASGPALDTKNIMKASLVHDALYQLMREEVLPQSARKHADTLLRETCLEKGMSSFRAAYIYYGVRIVGGFFSRPDTLCA